MKFSIDPWDPGYGGSVDADLGVSTAEVVTDVEVPEEQWAPVPTQPGLQPPATVLFVDGVRRVDAQVWVDEGVGTVAPGLCASYAAGIVCCCERDGAHLAAFEVRRSLVTAARDAEKIVTWAGTYDVVAAAAPHRSGVPAQLLSAALQVDLAKVETEVAGQAREEASGRDDLLVLDGQLKGPHPLPRAIGFVKSHDTTYLDSTLGAVVGGLAAGERTPVFRIGRPFPVFSWYLRLPGGSAAPWSGVARIECGGDLTASAAITLGRPRPGHARPLRLGRVQGRPRPAEPLPDRGPGAGAPAASRRARLALPRAAGRGRLNGLRQRRRHPPQQHRVVAARQQLGLLDGLGAPPDRPVRAAQLLGTEHGLAVERRGACQVEVGDHQPQRLEPDHAHAAGQASWPRTPPGS